MELVRILSDYGRYGAGGDDVPEQQLFGAQCVRAAALLAQAYGAEASEVEALFGWERELRERHAKMEDGRCAGA